MGIAALNPSYAGFNGLISQSVVSRKMGLKRLATMKEEIVI
jgi:hypothetical protein